MEESTEGRERDSKDVCDELGVFAVCTGRGVARVVAVDSYHSDLRARVADGCREVHGERLCCPARWLSCVARLLEELAHRSHGCWLAAFEQACWQLDDVAAHGRAELPQQHKPPLPRLALFQQCHNLHRCLCVGADTSIQSPSVFLLNTALQTINLCTACCCAFERLPHLKEHVRECHAQIGGVSRSP